MMDHATISKYTDMRVKISGWDERVQQFPKDCPCCSVGRATYRTFGYTTKHFIPKTTTQAMYEDVWNDLCPHRRRTRFEDCEVYRSTYQTDFGNRFPVVY